MKRYIVLELDDLVGDWEDTPGARVVGEFIAPGKYCPCPQSGYHKNGVVRGGKYGWWTHVVCRRAVLGGHQLKNLISNDERSYDDDGEYIDVISSLSVFEVRRDRVGDSGARGQARRRRVRRPA